MNTLHQKNPFGIVNSVDFNILADVGIFLGVTSGRSTIKLQDVERYCCGHLDRVTRLEKEINTLKAMEYDLGRKITIDSKYRIFQAYTKNLSQVVIACYKEPFIKKNKYTISYSEFCKAMLRIELYNIDKYQSAEAEVSNRYKKTLEQVRTEVSLKVGNKNVNEYKSGN